MLLKKNVDYQTELEEYKRDILEGLQVEEEGLTDLLRKKMKQVSLEAPSKNANDVSEKETLNNNNEMLELFSKKHNILYPNSSNVSASFKTTKRYEYADTDIKYKGDNRTIRGDTDHRAKREQIFKTKRSIFYKRKR